MDSNCTLNLNIPQFRFIEVELKKIHKEIQESKKINQKWYSLKAACLLKGCNYNTVKTNRLYQPCGGQYDVKLHGVKVWTREHIEEWVNVHDGNRTEYLQKFKITGNEKGTVKT